MSVLQGGEGVAGVAVRDEAKVVPGGSERQKKLVRTGAGLAGTAPGSGACRATPGTPSVPNLLQVSTRVKRKFSRHGELIRVPPRTPLPPTLTFDRGAGAALPIVPQVHRTFFNLAKDFKAALQLGARAVGPQSAHVHDPSLLLLVKREDRHKSQRLKVEVCCFSSAGLNEQVLIAPLPSGDPFLSPPAVLSLIGSACFPLSDKVASRAPAVCLANAAPPSLPPPDSSAGAIFIE